MKLKALALPALLVLALAVPNRSPRPSSRLEILTQSSSAWDGSAYRHYPAGQPQITVARITIAPHSALKWHSHPMANAAYVLSGSLTIEQPDGPRKRFAAGEALPEMAGVVHRGVTGDEPAVLIVFYAGARGLPLSDPAPATAEHPARRTEEP